MLLLITIRLVNMILVVGIVASFVTLLFTFGNLVGMGLEANYDPIAADNHVKDFKSSGIYLLISLAVLAIGIYMNLKGF